MKDIIAIPQKSFVEKGDVTGTDIRDRGLSKILGLDNYRGNALQHCLGLAKNTLRVLDFLTKPMQVLVKPFVNPSGAMIDFVKGVFRHVSNLCQVHSRQDLFPPFEDAKELLQHNFPLCQQLARDALFCSSDGPEGARIIGEPLPREPEEPKPPERPQSLEEVRAMLDAKNTSETQKALILRLCERRHVQYEKDCQELPKKLE